MCIGTDDTEFDPVRLCAPLQEFIYGKFYELKRNSIHGLETACTLFEDDWAIIRLNFTALPKPGTLKTLQCLRERGYKENF